MQEDQEAIPVSDITKTIGEIRQYSPAPPAEIPENTENALKPEVFEIRSLEKREEVTRALYEHYLANPDYQGFGGVKYTSYAEFKRHWGINPEHGDVMLVQYRGEEALAVALIQEIDRRNTRAWFRYYLNPDAKGKGLNRPAIKGFAGWALKNLGLYSLYCLTSSFPVQDILEKFRAEKCGCLPDFGYGAGDPVALKILRLPLSAELIFTDGDSGDDADGAGQE